MRRTRLSLLPDLIQQGKPSNHRTNDKFIEEKPFFDEFFLSRMTIITNLSFKSFRGGSKRGDGIKSGGTPPNST